MRKLKKFSVFLCVFLLLAGSSIVASAETETPVCIISTEESDFGVMPLIDWSGSTYVSTYGWSNVAMDNNLFGEYLDFTNSGNNKGAVWVRILDSDYNVICGPTLVNAGTTGTLGRVPASSGTYAVQAKAYTYSGVYEFSVKTRSIG